MKNSLKKVLLFGLFSLTFLGGWIVMMSCSLGSNSVPDIRTVYAGIAGFPAGTIASNNPVPINDLIIAENHAYNNYLNLEDLVTIPYQAGSHMYLQYGVSVFNCTDHDHLNAITTSNGHSAVGFTRDVRYGGTMWIQLVSQCEDDFDFDNMGDGTYFKGAQWYASNDFPTTPQNNIMIDQAFVTNCQYPGDRVIGAFEYGCGSDDVNHDD